MRIANKEYYLKIYRSGLDGAFVSTVYDFAWPGAGFRKQINGGLGNFSFSLPKNFDNFGQNDQVAKNNQVKLFCVSPSTGPNGTLIYTGWIYSTQATIDGSKDTVTINCYGNVTKGAKALLKNGKDVILNTTSTGLSTGAGSSQPVETIVGYIIDRYQLENTNAYFNYSATSLAATGISILYTFDKKMINEALTICQQAAPTGWWWYVDEAGVVWFQPKPGSPVHTFEFGAHFKRVDILDNSDGVINNLIFQSTNAAGNLLTSYRDAISEGQYDARWEVRTDNRVSLTATADNFGNSQLASNKNSIIRTTVEIVSNSVDPAGYPIETIQPGQCCKFRGFNAITSQNFTDNMLIVAVDYTPSLATLTLEELPDLASRQVLEAQQTAEIALGSNNITTLP